MAGIDNLTPVKPGQVLNPKGREKGSKNRATLLKQFMELKVKGINVSHLQMDQLPEGMSIAEAMTFKQLDNAIGGDLAAFKEIQDTVFGKIADKAQVNHSFKAMGTVKIGAAAGVPGSELEFDVGSDISEVAADEEPEDDED